MGVEPRKIEPRELAGLTPASEGPGTVIGGLKLPAAAPPAPGAGPGPEGPKNGLSDLVLNPQAPRPPEPGSPS